MRGRRPAPGVSSAEATAGTRARSRHAARTPEATLRPTRGQARRKPPPRWGRLAAGKGSQGRTMPDPPCPFRPGGRGLPPEACRLPPPEAGGDCRGHRGAGEGAVGRPRVPTDLEGRALGPATWPPTARTRLSGPSRARHAPPQTARSSGFSPPRPPGGGETRPGAPRRARSPPAPGCRSACTRRRSAGRPSPWARFAASPR